MSVHIVKLVVGVDDLADFQARQSREVIDYYGQPAVPCWTRFAPKRAEEILRDGGSIYRVIKNRIQCRHKILGFEMVDTEEKGRMCMIMQDPTIIRTVSTPKRPFQGWRYLKEADVPRDIGVYTGEEEEPPEEIAENLRAAGLL